MDKIEKLLSIGDLRTAGKSEEVIKLVFTNPELFENVVKAILSRNPGTRMRASDAVDRITIDHPEWLGPFKKLFLSKIIEIDQKEVKWHVAQRFPRFRLTEKEYEKVFHLMLGYLDDKSQIVKTFAMQALTDIAKQDTSYITKSAGNSKKSNGKWRAISKIAWQKTFSNIR